MQNEAVVMEWVEKAEGDFGFATSSIQLGNYFPQICFHYQQAAEKYLKAFVVANDLEFRPVHNLLDLLRTCLRKDRNAGELEDACRYLNPFYVDTRYPVHWPTQYEGETVLKARDCAAQIRDWVRSHLGL